MNEERCNQCLLEGNLFVHETATNALLRQIMGKYLY